MPADPRSTRLPRLTGALALFAAAVAFAAGVVAPAGAAGAPAATDQYTERAAERLPGPSRLPGDASRRDDGGDAGTVAVAGYRLTPLALVVAAGVALAVLLGLARAVRARIGGDGLTGARRGRGEKPSPGS
jgi:hypothetical protein